MKKKHIAILLSIISTQILAAGFKFDKLEINGVNEAEKAQLVNNFPVQIGSQINDSQLSDLAKGLYATNQYRNVEILKQNSTLVVNLLPKQIIKNISIEGISAVSKKDVKNNLKKVGVESGKPLDTNMLQTFVQQINKYYQSIGNNAVVVYKLNEIDMRNVDVIITTSKGNKGDVVKIQNISFEGNKAFSDSKLKGVISSKEKSGILFWRGKFNLENSNADTDLLTDFYQRKGYPKVSVSEPMVNYINSEKGSLVNIKYTIKEGDAYKFSGVKVLGEIDDNNAKVKKALSNIRIGNLFNGDIVKEVQKELTNIVGEDGYIQPNITVPLDFDENNKAVVVNYVVERGYKYNVNTINFSGNAVTKDLVLRREVPQMEGAWASLPLIEKGNTKLLQTGYFDDVEYEIIPTAEPGFVDVNYKVKERRTGSFQVGVGYGSDLGINYKLGLNEDNFLGTGHQVALNAQKSKDTTSLSVDFTKPYITQGGVSWVNSIYMSDYKGYKRDKGEQRYRSKTFVLTLVLVFH